MQTTTTTLLTTREVAVAAGISVWWVRQLIARGELRAVNVGGHGTAVRWRVDAEDLRAWLVSRESRARDLTGEGTQ